MTVITTLNSPNQRNNRVHHPRGFVLHTSGNSTQSGINTVMNANNQVSYHDIIAGTAFQGHGIVPRHDGNTVFQLVPITSVAWHAGTTVGNPGSNRDNSRAIPEFIRNSGRNANDITIGIAFGDFFGPRSTGGLPTAEQITNCARRIIFHRDEVLRIWNHRIPLTREFIVGHHEVNPQRKPNCPGVNFPWEALMNEINRLDQSVMNFKINGEFELIPGRIFDSRTHIQVRPLIDALNKHFNLNLTVGWEGETSTVTIS